jgi:hypothetical protein
LRAPQVVRQREQPLAGDLLQADFEQRNELGRDAKIEDGSDGSRLTGEPARSHTNFPAFHRKPPGSPLVH